MSFSRHAYRHVLKQPEISIIDHVWISEEQLASAFRRFANCQRRHQSRVPGPLEARRRLAQRKNTGLASIGASGSSVDVAGLFGMDGNRHMKGDDSTWNRSWPEPLEMFSYSMPPPEAPQSIPSGQQITSANGLPSSRFSLDDSRSAYRNAPNQTLEDSIAKCRTVLDVRKVVHLFRVDLQREPTYSRMIFDHLLSRSIHSMNQTCDELLLFLDDPALNVPGSGNYIALVEHLVSYQVTATRRHELFNTIERAIELGLIPGAEIGLIIRVLPKVRFNGRTLERKENQGEVAGHYRRIWDALRSCRVLRIGDLDDDFLNQWLYQLVISTDPTEEFLLLAKDMLLASHELDSTTSDRIPTLIIQCLDFSTHLAAGKSFFRDKMDIVDYVTDLLGRLNADLASGYVIQVCETLAFARRSDPHRLGLLELWRLCLQKIPNAVSLVSSCLWTEMKPFDTTQSLPGDSLNILTHHRVILRLWMLSSLSKSLQKDAMWRQHPKASDSAIIAVVKRFGALTPDRDISEFFGDLIRAIQPLDLPHNGILMMVYSLLIRKKVKNPATRQTIEMLETFEASRITLEDVVSDSHMFNATKIFFFPTFERLIAKIDVTSPEFISDSIRLIESGPDGAVELFRIIAFHTPLKIALGLAQLTPELLKPSPASTAAQEDSGIYRYLDPHACVEVMHLLAIKIASSKKLRATRAYHMIYRLCRFLRSHCAPIKPSFVRALYHVGVVRYRREGNHVAPEQYQYIMRMIRRYELPEIVEILEGKAYVERIFSNTPPRTGKDEPDSSSSVMRSS